jgi:type IV pilus assembly protein PilV
MTTRIIGHRMRGFTMIEILIALVLLAFGMLSLARGIARSSQEEFEAYQRSQAMELAQDIVERIESNRKHAVQYVGDYVPDTQPQDCSVAPNLVARDQCEWTNKLLGVDTHDAIRNIGAPVAARACITSPAPNVYIVAVAWQGVLPTGAPESSCGQDQFDREANRRVFSTTLQIATLGT